MDITQLWTNTLALLEPEISPISFQTWIQPIVPVKISGNTVVLRIDESFIKGMVETRFLTLIENSVKHLMGAEYKVSIISGDESFEEEKKAEEKAPKPANGFNSNLNPKYVFSICRRKQQQNGPCGISCGSGSSCEGIQSLLPLWRCWSWKNPSYAFHSPLHTGPESQCQGFIRFMRDLYK